MALHSAKITQFGQGLRYDHLQEDNLKKKNPKITGCNSHLSLLLEVRLSLEYKKALNLTSPIFLTIV